MLRPSLSPIAVLSVLFTVLLWAPRTQAEAPPAPESLRRHLVPQADLGQTLDWSEPMEFVPVAQVEELLKKRHDKAMDDFRRSRDAEKRSSELLPVTHLVRSASVQTRARAGSGWCQGELELEVEAIQPDDTLVAVLGGEVIVGSASVDGAPARISVSGGPAVSQNAPVAANAPAQAQQIQQSLNQMAQQSQTPAGAPRTVEVAIRGSGRHRLLVSFAARVTEEEFYSVVRFSLPGVPAAHLSATVPGKQVSASILPPCKLATRAGEAPATTLLEADLPPSPEVVLRWVEVADAGAAPAPAPESNATTGPGFASRVDATILHAYDAGEKGLAGEVTAWLRVRRAPISQLELHVPAGVKTLALVGPRNWTLQDPGPAGKARSARLLLPEKFTGDVQLKLDFTLDTRPSGFDTELAAFTLAGLARQPGFVAVTRSANLQLACSAPAGVDAVSAADLPAAIRPSLEGEELLFLYRRPDPALAPRLKGTRFPDAAVLAAVVDEARAWTLCESTGQIVGRVAYRFRSSGRESLTLDLAGFERTGLFLDGRTPAASQSGKSGVQVSLADVRAGQPSVLELRFRGAIPPLGPSGRVRLELPAIDVPVRELAWDVYTPRDFAFTPFEGIEGVRRGVAQPSDLLHPPDPSWPSAPQQMRALGLAAGARPAARSEYLASLLALYPLLMLFLFGGFVAHALKRLLIDGRGFAAATAAAGLGVFLAVAYIPYYQGGVAATLAGLTVHVVVMLGTALVRWGAGRGRAAAAGAAVLVLLAAAPESGAAGGGSPHERLLPRSDLLDRVKEAGRAQNENYLREKLARNRLQLQSEQQQNAAPPPAAQPRPAAREEGQAGADVDSVAPAPQSVAPAQSTVQILRGLNRKAPAPPAEPVAANAVQINEVPPTPPPRPAAYDIYIPYTGSPLSPREGTRGFFRKAQLDLLRSSLEVPKPPEAGSELHLLSAGYVLELAGGRATGSLSAALEATGSGWKELSIDIQPGSVTGWTIDGKPVAGQQALLERREGACVLRTVLAGRHSLEVRLSAPIVGTLQEGRLALGHVPEAPTRVVLRGVDPGCELLAAGPVAQIADGFELCLEPTAALSAGWRPKTVLPGGAAVTAPDDQERFSAESFAILSPAGGALGLRCRARLTIGEAGVRTVAFRLPEGFEFLETKNTSGEPIGEAAPQKDGRIVVKLPERTRGALVFEIYAERAAASADGVIELAGPAFPGAERESGFLALSPEPGTDAEMLQERGGRGIDVHELPDFAAPWASPELVLVRSFERPGYVFRAKATRRTRLDVAQLEATAAEASTLVADTGQTLTSITYQIRNTREQFLRLELPPEATLESVTVSGKPVKPAEGTGKTQRMIPLSPSRKTKQGLEAVAVAVVYSAPSGPLDRWGSWKAEVPRASVAVQEVTWNVYLPEGYRFFRTAGDFRDAGGAPSGALDRGYASADASAPSAEETAEGAASPEPQLAQAQQSSFVKKGLLGLSAPVPTTQNGKSYRLRLLKADAAAPKLELFFARTDLGDVVSGVVFYLALLALPMLVLGGSRTGKLGGALLVLGAASLALAASEYLDTGTGSLASGLASGGAFLLVYALFRPIRWWLAPAALMLLVSMSPVDAATPDAPGPILFPYGEKTLGKALDNADWRGLMPAGMARLAEELSRQQGETTTALPPLAYTIALGKLAANVSGETAVFELTADIDVLQDGYQTVLLAEGAFAVGAFRGDGLLSVQGAKDYASQESTQNDEILQKLNQGREKIQVLAPQLSASVVLTGKGRHRCVLEVVKAKPFELRLPPMATCSAVVKFDREGVDADVVGGLKGKVTSKDGQTVLEADLASGGEFRVEGYEAAPAARPEPAPEEHHDSTAPSAPPAPATTAVRQPAEQKPYLLADVRTDLSVGEGLLKGFAVIDYLAHRGRVASLELSVPEGLRISRIQDMEGKELPVPKLAKAEAGFHAVSLPAPPGSHKKLKLTLQFERTLADGEKTFRVPLVRTRATEFESGSVTVQREGHVEVAASKLEGIEEVPPDRLAFGTTAATSLAFKYSSPGPALEFTVERHDETRLSTVAVDAASVRTEFSEGGGTVTHLELEVRRSSGQYLQLKLPPGAEIQRAQRDGSAVDVSRAQDGSPLLPLDATRGPDSPASKLEVEYRGPEVQLGFAGSFEYTLPSCQLLPVTGRGLSWSLQPPEGYRFYASNRGWTEGSDLLGLWRQPPADSGKAYLAGPSTASAVRVRYLKSVPALGVAVLHQGLFLLLGLGAAAVIYGGFPGGAGLGLLVFALAMVALAVLQAAYPARAAGVQALDLGLLAGLLGCLVRHWKLRIARRAATAAAVLLLAGSLQAAQLPASKAPFVFVRSADAAAVLTAGDWLFLPRRAIEQTLAVLEKQKESKEPEEHPTPDPVLAQSGETELRVGGEDAEAAATYRFVVLADGPHEVALGNPGSVSSLQVDGKPADVTAESPGGALRVYLRGKGNHTVSTVFRVPVTRVKDAGWLQWDQPRTPLDRVAVRLPGTGRGIEIVPSLSTSAREEGGETRATAVVRMAGSVFVRWFEKGEKTAETPKQKEEARFEAESATGFKLDGIKVSGHTELTYRVTRGALSGVTLAVPPGTDVLEVTGQAVKSWKAEGATVEVLFDRFRSDAGVLAIEHVRRQPPGSIVLAPPEARGASTHVSLVAVRADESTELRATDTGDLRPIDPEELPPSLRSEGIPLAFRGEEGRRALTLDVQRKKGIDTPLFDISRMKLDVIPGQAGWTASRMELTLRNNSRQHLEISLPEGAVPLDCKVQNEPRKPGQSKSGLLIPLVRSKGRPDTLEPFTLELTYLAQDGPPGGAVERWLLPLPIVRDAPVDRLEIGVTTPRGRALALWSEGLDQRGQPLPAERVAGAMQAVAILGNPLVWVGGALGVVTSFTGRQNVSTMLTRGGSSFDHGENGRYYPSSPRPAMEAEKGMATGGIGRMAKLRHAGKKARQRFERDRLKAGFTQERTDAPARAQKSLAGALPEPDAARELADDEREVSAPAPTSALAASGPMQAPSLGKDEAAADGSAVGGELYGNAAGGGGGGGGDEVADKKADAYQALQRSLGDRGSLPVGVKCNAEGASTIVFEGALYPAGGTPATLTLLVYDPSVRMLLDLGFGLLSFFLTLITLDWAIQLGHRSPFFLVATVLPMAGYALEWRLGEGTVLVIVCGLFLGMAGAAARQMER